MSQFIPYSADQFRARRLQIFNWGTFSKLHTVPLAEKGHLLTGASGAGKSTIEDGIATLLTPPRILDYNTAAREGERSRRDRNLAMYVRGAWGEQTDAESGELTKRFLRTGSTWSALALAFHNGRGQHVVLVQLFWIRGEGTAHTDVKRLYLIFESNFDIESLSDFGEDFDVRRLKAKFPDAHIRDEFRAYQERFCRLLDIGSEQALRLWHKTQSAKNLGDLNVFLREFMLDPPATFECAERLVGDFGVLNEAHQAVVTARKQVEILTAGRVSYDAYCAGLAETVRTTELVNGVDVFKYEQTLQLTAARITQKDTAREGARGREQQTEDYLKQSRKALEDLRAQHRDAGGTQLTQWQDEFEELEKRLGGRIRKQGQIREACRALDWDMPATPEGFADMLARARQEVESRAQQQEQLVKVRDDLAVKLHEVKENIASAHKEAESLRRQRSNLPSYLVDMRDALAAALRLKPENLPFAGELMEVSPEAEPWHGAIERVLGGFAKALLVEERHYDALSRHVNQTSLGTRLVYYRTNRPAQVNQMPTSDSLPRKLNLKDGVFYEWLQAELASRFNYACVDSLDDFKRRDKALTITGLVKHGPARHEKDDTYDIRDSRRWVLGFDNQAKLKAYDDQGLQLVERMQTLEARKEALEAQVLGKQDRLMNCKTLTNIEWQEIDVGAIVEAKDRKQKLITDVQASNRTLAALDEEIGRQQKRVSGAEDAASDARQTLKNLDQDLVQLRGRINDLQQKGPPSTFADDLRADLETRFEFLQPLTLENLSDRCHQVSSTLRDHLGKLRVEITEHSAMVRQSFHDFKRDWPLEAADLGETIESAEGYFAKLTRLEEDGLPEYETKFFELLRQQSDQNLASLATQMNMAGKEMFDRLDLVNRGLADAEFNPGTFLKLESTDCQLEPVRMFKAALRQALSDGLASDDRSVAEERFELLQTLVGRLGSQKPEDERWRNLVLDVRQHYEFIGRESDEKGLEVEVYRSAAGKSGGQRQKLTTFCLAAALRYQLGGSAEQVPNFALVILDEAFSNADAEFTGAAMNIFRQFGFQMLVATPLKSVATLSPFIGGATLVDIRDRKHSFTLIVDYDDVTESLNLLEAHSYREAVVEAA